MASLAQMERELMVERTQAGLQAACQQGRVGGRKGIMTDATIRSAGKLLKQGTPPRKVRMPFVQATCENYRRATPIVVVLRR